MKLQDMKIATQLKLGFAVMAVLIGLLGAVALERVGAIRDAFDEVMKNHYPKVVQMSQIRTNADKMARAVSVFRLEPRPS